LGQPNKSSKAPPLFWPLLSIDCIGAAVEDAAGAPQIPAVAFCFCMAARLGPELPEVGVILMPALALAVDHKDPKASPPDAEALAAGFENEGVEPMDGLAPGAGEG